MGGTDRKRNVDSKGKMKRRGRRMVRLLGLGAKTVIVAIVTRSCLGGVFFFFLFDPECRLIDAMLIFLLFSCRALTVCVGEAERINGKHERRSEHF